MPINSVMYHYVRNNEVHDFDTYCRRKDEFEAQIDFFMKDSLVINPYDSERIDYYLKSDSKDAYLLTFDDGYIDHLYCAESLASRNLSAYFFPPINSIDGELLDVNAIHILIGTRGLSIDKVLEEVSDICLEEELLLSNNKKKVNIKTYLDDFIADTRYDRIDIIKLKNILQRDLIGDINRKHVIDLLIKKFVGKTSLEISNDLYLGLENMIKMKNMGMAFGSHGKTHRWLNSLNGNEQKIEIEQSFCTLKELKLIEGNEPQAMCYPFGAFNDETLNIMSKLKIDIGLTTEVGSSKLNADKRSIFKLSRWDTNDFWNNEWRKPCTPQ